MGTTPASIVRDPRNIGLAATRAGEHHFFTGMALSALLVALIGFRRPHIVCAVALVVALASVAVVARYIAADPFEYDIKQLRSEGRDAVAAREWMELSDKHFGRGITGRTYIAAT